MGLDGDSVEPDRLYSIKATCEGVLVGRLRNVLGENVKRECLALKRLADKGYRIDCEVVPESTGAEPATKKNGG